MPNINLTQVTYVDYVASLYMKAAGVANFKVTPKYAPATDKMSEPTILMHVDGIQPETGRIVNLDMFARNNFTEEDLDKLFEKVEDKDGKVTYKPKSIGDFHFRVGYLPLFDDLGKPCGFREGKPKWIAYIKDGNVVTLSGEKRECPEEYRY